VARFRFGRSSPSDGGIRQSGTDALGLVIDYIKQETLTPLKGLGRYLLFGIVGSIMLCVGLVLLLLAFLRALQEETGGFFAGTLTWAPYVIVGGAAAILMALAAWRIVRAPAARRRRPPGDKK
jgi:Putative Actinobacterial Holin-X, holin superfamily III